MTSPNPNRKYYIVAVKTEEDGGRSPDITLPAWTARYLSADIALVRDPAGLYDFPILGVDVSMEDAIASLPIQLSMSMSQEESDYVNDSLGLKRVDLEALSNDRAGG